MGESERNWKGPPVPAPNQTKRKSARTKGPTKAFTVRMVEADYEEAFRIAAREGRTVNNWCGYVVSTAIKAYKARK